MILPAKHRLKIWKGATLHYKFTYADGNYQNGITKDLTGYKGRMIIKDEPDGNILITLNSSNNGVKINGPEGTIELFISSNPADNPNTSNINWKSAFYELLLDNGQQTEAVLYGQISVSSY